MEFLLGTKHLGNSGDGGPSPQAPLGSMVRPSLVLGALMTALGLTGAGSLSASDSPASLGGTISAFIRGSPESGPG